MKKPTRTNLVLGATAMALALTLAAKMGGADLVSSAYAQPRPTTEQAQPPSPGADTPFNAAEQRKQAIIQLQEINRRLTSIEQKMSSGLSVKVTEMPEVRVKDPSKKQAAIQVDEFGRFVRRDCEAIRSMSVPVITNHARRATNTAAFTLLEMLAVVCILGIAGAMVIPTLGDTGVLRVQAAVRTVVSDLTFAQCDAVAFQEKRAVVFDTDTSSYRVVSIPGDILDPDTNTMYDPTRTSGQYIVDFRDEAFGDARITTADFDSTDRVIFDALGGPVADPAGNTAGQGGRVRIEGSNSIYDVNVEAFTGRVTVTKVQ